MLFKLLMLYFFLMLRVDLVIGARKCDASMKGRAEWLVGSQC